MIYLASSSPRRKELMEKANIPFKIEVIKTNEIFNKELPFDDALIDIAFQKGLPVAKNHPNDTVISADTIVLLDDEILGKPKDLDEARTMLKKLSGKCHLVKTSVCIFKEKEIVKFTETTKVYFKSLSDLDIEKYIKEENVLDKAGAYAIQSKMKLVDRIVGSYSNVVGFPIERIEKLL